MAYSTINAILGGSSGGRRKKKPPPAPTPSINAVLGAAPAPAPSPSINAIVGSSSPASVNIPTTVPASSVALADSRRLAASSGLRPESPRPESRVDRRDRRRVLQRVLGRTARIAESEVPGSGQFARSIARDAIAASRKTGVPASLLVGLTGQESGYGTNTGPSSAGARSATQFIPSTRDYMIEKYGVDPWRSQRDSLVAAGLYLKELGVLDDPTEALSSYSGGYAEGDYNNPILTRAQQFAQTGIDRVTGNVGRGGSRAGSRVPKLVRIGKKAERRFGVEAREHPFFDPVDPVHTEGSMHYSGDAIDFQGSSEQLDRLNRFLARRYGSQTDELFYDPGINIADGQRTSPIGGHPSHVHFGLDDGRRGEIAYPVGGAAGYGGTTLDAAGQPIQAFGELLGDYGLDRRSQARQAGRVNVIRSPLAARAVLPRGFRGDEPEDEEEGLMRELEAAFRPRRRRS